MEKKTKLRTKKIIFFSRDLNIGGMEKALVSLLNALAEKKYQITLVLTNKEGVLLQHLNESIRVKQYTMSRSSFIPLRRAMNLIHRVVWGIFHYHRYDFSCNYATYSEIGSKLAILASANSALYVHSNYPALYQDDQEQLKCFFNSIDIKFFRKIIFVSKESMESTKKFFPQDSQRFKVINNLIDFRFILDSAEKNCDCFDSNCLNFLFVGRLDDSSKNFDLLLNSFKAAYDRSGLICLTIVGEGKDRLKIQQKIADEKIEGVHLVGEKENPYPYIKSCDCLLLTSKYEGYPVVYSEALVLNKQFITTVPVSDDFIDVRNYFTICNPDSNDVADEMLKIKKKTVDYKIDFDLINDLRIQEFERIIC